MVPHTRRRFLHVAAATASGLAGCNQVTGGEADSTRSATPAAEPSDATGATSNRATDPPRLLLRAGTRLPPIRFADPDRETLETTAPDRLHSRMRHAVVDSESRAERISLADGVDGGDVEAAGDVGDADSVAAFVAGTDFDSETIYLETHQVQECFRLKLCHVSWQPSGIDTDYTRRLRPYDERCAADAHVFESRLIRLPVALDESDVNSYGSSIGGSGHCDPRGPARGEDEGGSASSDSNLGSDATATPARPTDGGEQ
jgi:hypothetical protein